MDVIDLNRPQPGLPAPLTVGTATIISRAIMTSDLLLGVLELRGASLVFSMVNQAVCDATGFDEASLIGRTLDVLDPEPATPPLAEQFRAAYARGELLRPELRCHAADGRPIVLGLTLIPDRDGDVIRAVVIGRDVTQAQREREQEARVQGLLAKVFAVVDTPLYIADLDGRIMLSNPAFERLLGAEPGTLTGVGALNLVDGAAHANILRLRERQEETGEEIQFAATMLRRDGSRLPCDFTSNIIGRVDLRRLKIVTVRPSGASSARPSITAGGQVQVIGLEEVRESLGERWGELRERVLGTAEHVIRRHLRAGDSVARTDEHDFVVFFGDATEEQATVRSAEIGRAVRTRLIGESAGGAKLHVLSAAVVLPPEAAGLSPKELEPVVRRRVEQRLAAIQREARDRLKTAMGSLHCETRPVRTTRGGRELGRLLGYPAETERALATAMSLLPEAETAELNTDALLLEFAHQAAAETALRGSKELIFLPVELEVLLHRKRVKEFADDCSRIGTGLRKQLVLLVTVPAAGDATRLLKEAMIRVRPFFRSVGLITDAAELDEISVAELGISFAAVNLTDKVEPRGAELRRLADKLRAQRCATMAINAAGADPRLLEGNVELYCPAGGGS